MDFKDFEDKKELIGKDVLFTFGKSYGGKVRSVAKICKVTNPDLKIFVAESIAGNDATQQAKAFNEAVGIDGSVLSKADIDEKGGTIISVSYITQKPIFYLGTGQNYNDLEIFDKEKFIEKII